jgi:predicted DNA-binding transcriptional regulator AlpA
MLISIPGISRMTGRSEKTIRRHRDQLPGAVKFGGRVLYDEAAIRKFIEAGGTLAADQGANQTPTPGGAR